MISPKESEPLGAADLTGPVTAVQAQPDCETALPPLTLELFRATANEFTVELAVTPLPDLFGATDGRAVGAKVESMFKEHLRARYDLEVGNAATGLEAARRGNRRQHHHQD